MYAHVENNTVTYKGDLPRNWRNVSGLRLATDAELLEMGWLPYSEVKPALGANQVYDGETLNITASSVTSTAGVRDMTAGEIDIKREGTKHALASYRYDKEVGGVTVGGIPVATDRETQSKLIAARILAKEDANYSVDWKGTGGFVTLDAATIISVADAVATYVQACFTREKVLAQAISDAADPSAVDITTGWPS
jgi:hypothetical protein